MDFNAIVEVYTPDGEFLSTFSLSGTFAYEEARMFAERAGEVKVAGSVIELPGLGLDDGIVTFVPEGFEPQRLSDALQQVSLFPPKLTKLFMVIASREFLDHAGDNFDDNSLMRRLQVAQYDFESQLRGQSSPGLDDDSDLDDGHGDEHGDPEAVLDAATQSATRAGMNLPPMG